MNIKNITFQELSIFLGSPNAMVALRGSLYSFVGQDIYRIWENGTADKLNATKKYPDDSLIFFQPALYYKRFYDYNIFLN